MSTGRHDYMQHPDPYSVRLHGVPDEPQEPASVECVKEHLAAMMRASYGERAPLIVGWGHLVRRDTYSNMVEDCQALVARTVERIRSSTPTCPACDAFPLLCPYHGAENAREPVEAASEPEPPVPAEVEPTPVPIGTRVLASDVLGIPEIEPFHGTVTKYDPSDGAYEVQDDLTGRILWVSKVEPLDDEAVRRTEHNARMIQAGAVSPAEVRRQMLGPLKLPANDGPPPGYEFQRGSTDDRPHVIVWRAPRQLGEGWIGSYVFPGSDPDPFGDQQFISQPEHRPALEWAKRMLSEGAPRPMLSEFSSLMKPKVYFE